MHRLKAVGLFPLAALLVAGCVTKYVVVTEISRSELRVVVFTDNSFHGHGLLSRFEELGFDNVENEVREGPNDEFNIKWGAAPTAYVEQLARVVQDLYDRNPARHRVFEPFDYDVFINLPVDPSELPDREEFGITVFTDDEGEGEVVLGLLSGLGYGHDDNEVLENPNDEYNIKWGAAPAEFIDEIADAIEDEYDVVLDRQHVFEGNDHDIFTNLPLSLGDADLSARDDFEITVFCDDEELGEEVLVMLSELGYNNEASEVLEDPNEEYNIKYGGLPEEFLTEIADALEAKFGAAFERLDYFDEDDRMVFIIIPGR